MVLSALPKGLSRGLVIVVEAAENPALPWFPRVSAHEERVPPGPLFCGADWRWLGKRWA